MPITLVSLPDVQVISFKDITLQKLIAFSAPRDMRR